MPINQQSDDTQNHLVRKELSILLPTWNEVCVETVRCLKQQCDDIEGLKYEIIVADDGSTDRSCVSANRTINHMANCRLLEKQTNTGSGSTRNLMVLESRFAWILFLDCDMIIPPGLIARYLEVETEAEVINGGICVSENGPKNNLRFLYERSAAPRHSAHMRNKHPYRAFRSTNFLVTKSVMQRCPFYEPLKRFEDNYFGYELEREQIKIAHIDNPTVLESFEDNALYVSKLECDLRILDEYREQLHTCSALLRLADRLHGNPAGWLVRRWHLLFGKTERRNLSGSRPFLPLLSLYRLGYLCLWINRKR